jgi:hypothetical protein
MAQIKFTPLDEQPSEISITLRGETPKIDFTPIEEEEVPKNPIIKAWEAASTPIVNVPGSSEVMKKEHPIIAGIGDFAAGVLSSTTSPLNIAMGGLFGGGKAAAAAGLTKTARALLTATKPLSAGMIVEGAQGMIGQDNTWPERIGGGLETLGGIAGLRTRLPRIMNTSIAEAPILKPPIEVPEAVQSELPFPKPAPTTPVGKLAEALGRVKFLNKEQAKIYSEERSKRIGQVRSVTTKGQAGAFERLGKLKGEYEKVEITPLELPQEDIDILHDNIQEHPTLTDFAKIHADSGLTKLLTGKVPQPSEAALLEQVFGSEVADMLAQLQKGRPLDQKQGLFSEIYNLSRGLLAAGDLTSAAFRQARPAMLRSEWWKAWNNTVKSFGSEKAFKIFEDKIKSDPLVQPTTLIPGKNGGIKAVSYVDQVGLKLSSLEDFTKREEYIMSTMSERVPLGIGKVVRMSNRAATIFLNEVRLGMLKSFIKDAAAMGEDLHTNIELGKDLANLINDMTGRGSLTLTTPKIGKIASKTISAEGTPYPALANTFLFSPRLAAAQIKMYNRWFNPISYVNENPIVRKEKLKALLAVAGFWGTLNSAGKLIGAEISDDSNSADFGKARFGDLRIDTAGGMQKWLVAASRLVQQKTTSSTTGKTRVFGEGFNAPTIGSTVGNLAYNSLHPTARFAWDLLNATDVQGSGKYGSMNLTTLNPMENDLAKQYIFLMGMIGANRYGNEK